VSLWNPLNPWGSKDPDEGLVSAARRGDRRAFDSLVHVYQSPLRGFVAKRVAPAAVDDVLQETWLAAWAALPRFAGRSRFKAWLFSIALHKAVDAQRTSIPAVAGPETLEEQAADGDPFAAADIRHMVQAALSGLSEPQREVLDMYYYAELTMRRSHRYWNAI